MAETDRMREQQPTGREHLFIDPSYRVFDKDGLFDLVDPVLNRDGQLLAFQRLRERMQHKGVTVHTADFLLEANPTIARSGNAYYSLGILDNFERILRDGSARLSAFVVMEPPVVVPQLYAALPRLTSVFDRVYVHNTHGDAYSLKGVDQARLHKLYWPIPYDHVVEPYWSKRDRMKRVVVINGSHNPRGRSREQYSMRLDAMGELFASDAVDLYGMGWNRWWSRSALWWPYWRNVCAIGSIYRGPCASKFEVMQNYDFCLCFENMAMDGYITEKIFDCFYAGTIPLYMGANDLAKYVPAEAFIDCRQYASWTDMWNDVSSMPASRIESLRHAARDFLGSAQGAKFHDFIERVCEA